MRARAEASTRAVGRALQQVAVQQVAVLLVAMVGVSCATYRTQDLVRERLAEYVYPQSREALWPEIRDWTHRKGWVIHEYTERFAIVSDWAEDMDGHTYVRYQVEALEARGGTSVRILRQSQNLSDGKLYFKRTGRPERFMMTTMGPTHTKRAFDLELELLRQFDRPRADQIERDARAQRR